MDTYTGIWLIWQPALNLYKAFFGDIRKPLDLVSTDIQGERSFPSGMDLPPGFWSYRPDSAAKGILKVECRTK